MAKPTFLKWWLLGLYSLGICILPQSGNQLYAQINTFPYLQDFESSNGGWVASPIVPALSNFSSWEWATPATAAFINSAASGTKCWVTGNSVLPPLVSYAYFSNEYSQIVSPSFDFSGLVNPGIKINIWWESEYSVDGTVFQSSIDGGNTWQTVGGVNDPVFWYNDNAISGGISGPGGQTEGWTGQASTGTGSNGWRAAQHGLEGLGGQPNVRFRFAFSSDPGSTVADGFAFDDIFIADRPDLNLGSDTVVCFADTVFLNACTNGVTSFSWSSNPLIDTLCTKVVVSSGLYIVTALDTLDFVLIDTVDVTVSETNVILPPDQLICPGDTILLDADNSTSSHLWLPDSTQSQFLEVWENGTYIVEVSDGFGCLEVDSISVFIDFVPDVDLGPDTIICPGESIVLDAGSANPGTTYSWTPFAATTQTIFVSSPGDFQVVVTTGAGCLATDSVEIGFSLDPVVNLGPDRIECGIFTLDAGNTGASSFLWSTSDTSQTISTDQGGLYWVEVFNQFGCSSRDSVLITPALLPDVNLGANAVICDGIPIVLDPNTTGISYLWNTGDMSPTLTVSNPGIYSVTVTNGQNCEGSDTIQVSLSTLQVQLGADITICEGDSILLDAGNTAESYLWSSGESTQMIWASQDQVYTVIVSDGAGCEITDQIQVSTQTNFVPQFSVAGELVLMGQVEFADQSTGTSTSWLWDFGDGTTSTDEMPMHTYQSIGTFTVCLTVSDGICTNTTCEEVAIDIFDGIEEELGLDMLVYPNPNSGQFTIDLTLPAPREIKVELFDLSGKQMFAYDAGNVQSWTKQINESQLAEGLYLLKVSVDQVDVYRKISIN